jgi:DNA-directed RNA polymerase specialized sigma24 family protein
MLLQIRPRLLKMPRADRLPYPAACVRHTVSKYLKRERRLSHAPAAPDDAWQADPADHLLEQFEVERMLDQLPRHDRLILECRFRLGLSDRESAALLHTTATAVKMRRCRVLARLRTVAKNPVTFQAF